MKKVLLCLISCLPFCAVAQTDILSFQPSDRLNRIVIDFTCPNYSIEDTILPDVYQNGEVFKTINVEGMGITCDCGLPELPQYTSNIWLQKDAYDIDISFSNIEYDDFCLSGRIIPSQEMISEGSNDFVFNIDNEYYSGTGNFGGDLANLSDPFIVFGEKGVSVSIFPFQYLPYEEKLRVVNRATVIITYTCRNREDQLEYTSAPREDYLHKFFSNYTPNIVTGNSMGRYLIITPERYENELQKFVDYKGNLGYEVLVGTISNDGISNETLRDVLSEFYADPAMRPDFVLLVGDTDVIPAFYDDLTTDIYYTTLDGDDLYADIFLGRFSVESREELVMLIDKTINTESNARQIRKKALLIAGDMACPFNDTYNYYEVNYDEAQIDARNRLQDIGYNCTNYHSYDGVPIDTVENAFCNDYHLIVYRGHGDTTKMVYHFDTITYTLPPACLHGYQIDGLEHDLYPLMLSIACFTGYYGGDSICFGERWTRSRNGGCAFWGSTTNGCTRCNNYIENSFVANYCAGNNILSSVINLSMIDFLNNHTCKISYNKLLKEYKSYNLLGDPSLSVHGIGCQSYSFLLPKDFTNDTIVTYQTDDSIKNYSYFKVQSGCEVELLSSTQVILSPGFCADEGSDFWAAIVSCSNNGSDFVHAVCDNTIDKQLIKKSKNVVNVVSVYPNPTDNTCALSFEIEQDVKVVISLFTIFGQKLGVLLDEYKTAGQYKVGISLEDRVNGIYIIEIKIGNQTKTIKIIKQ